MFPANAAASRPTIGRTWPDQLPGLGSMRRPRDRSISPISATNSGHTSTRTNPRKTAPDGMAGDLSIRSIGGSGRSENVAQPRSTPVDDVLM